MRCAKLCDIPIIITILESHYGEGALKGMEYYLSSKVRNLAENMYVISEDNSMFVLFERIGMFKAQFHVYSLPSSRGKKLKDFFNNAFEAACSSYNYTSFLTFIPEGYKKAEIAAKIVGCKYIGTVPNANDSTNEKLYSLTKGGATSSLKGRAS